MKFFMDTDEEDEDEYGYEDPFLMRSRGWDSSHVMRKELASLVPVFDPRPGRHIISALKELDIPAPGAEQADKQNVVHTGPKLKLTLKCNNAEVALEDRETTLFYYVHTLYKMVARKEPMKKIWDQSYTLVYQERQESKEGLPQPSEGWPVSFVMKHLGSDHLPKSDLIVYLQRHGTPEWLKRWKLHGTTRNIKKNRNCKQLVAAYKDLCRIESKSTSAPSDPQHPSGGQQEQDNIEALSDTLDLLCCLHSLAEDSESGLEISAEEFVSLKLNQKLMHQIQDPLALCCQALPRWCHLLTSAYSMLFPFDTRQLFFSATALGAERSVIWIQKRQEEQLDRMRGPAHHKRGDDLRHEFRIGRLRQDSVTVTRDERVLDWADSVFKTTSDRKSILEIKFKDEEGTGLGPSLEYYALVAAEFQRRNLGVWICDDTVPDDRAREVDIGQGIKPPGYYIQSTAGLFPAPWPQDAKGLDNVCHWFHLLGLVVARCMQDNRLLDIPLSQAMFKLLCQKRTALDLSGPHKQDVPNVAEEMTRDLVNEDDLNRGTVDNQQQEAGAVSAKEDILTSLGEETDKDIVVEKEITMETATEELLSVPSSPSVDKCAEKPWFSDILTLEDLSEVMPHRTKFLKDLQELVDTRNAILKNPSLSAAEKQAKIRSLHLPVGKGSEDKVPLKDLCLSFVFEPPSSVYGFSSHPLKSDGDKVFLNVYNADEYIDLMGDFCLHSGIQRQLEAFKAGVDKIFPMEQLSIFSPHELRLLLCGEQVPNWTREDILNYTEPKHGFTRECRGYQLLVTVLCDLSSDERKAFVQFVTGCSSLPPGGLANLYPRLTIVKKEFTDIHVMPSVNTCAHYLKIPEYPNEEMLKSRLLAATKEKAFLFN